MLAVDTLPMINERNDVQIGCLCDSIALIVFLNLEESLCRAMDRLKALWLCFDLQGAMLSFS